jgi:hypothetical protein
MEMSDESNNKRQELQRVQDELKNGGVSRRNFLDRMKGLGVGFGAAFLLGIKESHASRLDPSVSVKSTNPAIDDIVKDGQAAQEAAGTYNSHNISASIAAAIAATTGAITAITAAMPASIGAIGGSICATDEREDETRGACRKHARGHGSPRAATAPRSASVGHA